MGSPPRELSGAAGQAEADVVVAVVRVVVVPVADGTFLGIVVPAAAAVAAVGGYSVQPMADALKWDCNAFFRNRNEHAVLA